MQRITNSDLEAVLGRYVRAAERLEMVPDGGFKFIRSLDSYELRSAKDYDPAPGTDMGWVGSSKPEAYRTVMTMTLTLESYLHHTDQL